VSETENKAVVARLWDCLYRKDWDGLKALIAPDGHYKDVPTPDPGATLSRLRVSPAEVLTALTRALTDRRVGGAALSIAAGRNLPDVRVDPDALYHLLLTLVHGSLEATAPGGRVRVAAKHQGRRVILSVIDDGRQVDLDEIRSGSTPRGRELAIRVADTVLRLMGGRAAAELRRRGTRIDLFLPATTLKKP
jgi:signal transduction histidine kinase